jgi:EAL domain-containing protein (putative c-di-GMP-specific phosphodiesterase class I)/CheY-like chemotaxis protein
MNSDLSCAQSTYPRIEDQITEGTAAAASHFMPKVLLVDDERHVVEGARAALLKYPYRIGTATSPEVALQMFRQEPCDVIVADEVMPGMRGSELLTVIAREFPTTGRILLTGHATVEAAARAINEAGVIRFLLKPCPPNQLRAAIETALRTTPFEKRARTGARRVFLVSESERMAGQTNADASELMLQAQKVLVLNGPMLYGYEISARLRTQGGNVHTVGNFIASADHRVRLPSVDRWVVRHVLSSLRQYERMLDYRRLTVSLNIGGQSLADPEFAEFLDSELATAPVATRFMLEIRESMLAKRVQADAGLLKRLADMNCFKRGCRLFVDGVSGEIEQLSFLSGLPIAIAKIDSRYIGDILTNRESEERVRSIVKWGERTGVHIGAAGIDTVAIAERLLSLGVRYGQGSAFGGVEPLNLVLGSLYN